MSPDALQGRLRPSRWVAEGGAAEAYLRTAAQLAEQTGHAEIAAWCLETRAWDVLTGGDYRQAIRLSQHAQAIAPADGSAVVQATAQEGRAWGRLGDRPRTGEVLARVERLADRRAQPDQPEHHYRYDPGKAHAYAATTLAWAGDPAAEAVARQVVDELSAEGARPRRIASARLDLALALLGSRVEGEVRRRRRAVKQVAVIRGCGRATGMARRKRCAVRRSGSGRGLPDRRRR